PRGRVATPAAWTHLGMVPPAGAAGLGIPPGYGEQGLFDTD
ncbi:Holliday junction branch migration DNA helicase RuvB, partial [Mycolicibacter senuensis]